MGWRFLGPFMAAVVAFGAACTTQSRIGRRDARGRKIAEETYLDGRPHGRWTTFHDNGRKSSEGEYRDGRKHGHWTHWNDHGKRVAEGDFVGGVRVGAWTFSGPGAVQYVRGRAVGVYCERGDTPIAGSPPGSDGKPRASMDKEIIRRVIRRHIRDVKRCYESALARQPDLAGRVVVRFTIIMDGSVCQAHVVTDEMQDPEVGSCISNRMLDWSFPMPEGGGSVIVTYPFILTVGP